MSKSNGVAAPLMLFLLLTSVVRPKLLVFGSPDDDDHHQHSFKRADPLRHFKSYNGTYDVIDKHYWASAAFTGVHGYVIAAIWILSGLGLGLFATLKSPRSGPFSDTDHFLSNRCHVIMFLLIVLFAILAIVATAFVLTENENCLKKNKKLKNTILNAGENVRQTIQQVINSLIVIDKLLLKYDKNTSLRLNVTVRTIENGSQAIHNFVHKSGHSIDEAIQASYFSHLVIVSINLTFVVAGIVLLLLHWHPGLITIIFLCWILTALCWVLTGIDFFLHTFTEDTCSALKDFVQNPQNNSLSALLPCMSSRSSDNILSSIGYTIHKFIAEVNQKIQLVYTLLRLNKQDDDVFGYWKICDPFSAGPNYTYVPESCTNNAIQIGELPQVLSSFTCYNGDSKKACISNGKFIPQIYYDKARAYSESVQGMLNVYPDFQSLTECTILKRAFSDVVRNQCRSLKSSVRLLWSSTLSLSVFMVALVLTWVTKASQEKGRSFSRWSINPNPNPA